MSGTNQPTFKVVPKDSITAIIGPTAVGKTAVGLAVAEVVGGEIISADSRQIFKPLTIGTAKPSTSELERVPHHFINELDLSESFSAGQFAASAVHRIKQILSRGRHPIVVGGSTLYIEALVHGLSDIPSTTQATRSRLMGRLAREGAESLYQELQHVDPESAATMDVSKTQRIVRALEVFEDTGRPLTYYHQNRPSPAFDFNVFVLDRPRRQLYERINARVELMLEQGLLKESREVYESTEDRRSAPLRTIGYKEAFRFINEEISYEEMVRLIKRNSRRYAKRQITWFRRKDAYHWIDSSRSPRSVAKEVLIRSGLEDK